MRAAMMSWMVAGTVTSARLKPRLAVLDGDPPGLLKLAEDLLDVERIALALFGEDLEQLLGDLLRGEQGAGPSPGRRRRRGLRAAIVSASGGASQGAA